MRIPERGLMAARQRRLARRAAPDLAGTSPQKGKGSRDDSLLPENLQTLTSALQLLTSSCSTIRAHAFFAESFQGGVERWMHLQHRVQVGKVQQRPHDRVRARALQIR